MAALLQRQSQLVDPEIFRVEILSNEQYTHDRNLAALQVLSWVGLPCL
jgi:hypothetical protein